MYLYNQEDNNWYICLDYDQHNILRNSEHCIFTQLKLDENSIEYLLFVYFNTEEIFSQYNCINNLINSFYNVDIIKYNIIDDGNRILYVIIFLNYKNSIKQIIIKNSYYFLGTNYYYELKIKELSIKYIEELFIRLMYAQNLITELKIPENKCLCPSLSANYLLKKYSIENCIYSINLKLPIYTTYDFICKYYFVILHLLKIKLNIDHFKNFSNFKNYYIPTTEEIQNYFKDKIIFCNDNNVRYQLSQAKKRKDFYKYVYSYLNSTNLKYKNREDHFFKTSHFGGRLEIIKNINPEKGLYIIEIDIPGAYFSCFSDLFPIGIPMYNINVDTDSIINDLSLYDCSVYACSDNLPVLPYKFIYKGKKITCFPNGMFKGTWWGFELKLFKEMGGIILKIETEIFWKEYSRALIGVYNYITDITPTKYNYEYLKKIKTCMYGNFSSKKSNRINTEFYINSNQFVNREEEELYSETNDIYSGLITAKNRVKLYKLNQLLLKEKLEVLFLNTDSITFQTSLQQFDELKTKYPEYTHIWNKNNIYEDIFFINTRQYFLKKEHEEFYLSTQNEIIELEDMKKLKEKFLNINTKEPFIINNIKINPESYTKRLWNENRFNTIPIFIKDTR